MANTYSKLSAICLAFYLGQAVADNNEQLLSPVKTRILTIDSIINLDNLFQPEIRQLEHVLETSRVPDNHREPIQLVGTLIMGSEKRVWIKVASNPAYELIQGESIPGSSMRIGRINPDSVEIINTGHCVTDSSCRKWLMLNTFQD